MAPQSPTEREAVATASDWKTGPEAGTVAPALVFCGSRLPQPCCCTAGNPQVSPTLGIWAIIPRYSAPRQMMPADVLACFYFCMKSNFCPSCFIIDLHIWMSLLRLDPQGGVWESKCGYKGCTWPTSCPSDYSFAKASCVMLNLVSPLAVLCVWKSGWTYLALAVTEPSSVSIFCVGIFNWAITTTVNLQIIFFWAEVQKRADSCMCNCSSLLHMLRSLEPCAQRGHRQAASEGQGPAGRPPPWLSARITILLSHLREQWPWRPDRKGVWSSVQAREAWLNTQDWRGRGCLSKQTWNWVWEGLRRKA
jgi:hypothetical protein